jgi:hypothetical protein
MEQHAVLSTAPSSLPSPERLVRLSTNCRLITVSRTVQYWATKPLTARDIFSTPQICQMFRSENTKPSARNTASLCQSRRFDANPNITLQTRNILCTVDVLALQEKAVTAVFCLASERPQTATFLHDRLF